MPEKNLSEDIKLIMLHTLKSNYEVQEAFFENIEEVGSINFSFGHTLGFEFESAIARCMLTFDCKAMNKNDKELGITYHIELEYFYEIDHFEEYCNCDQEEKSVDGDLGAHILAISYSTSRGIVFEKTQNTFFKGFLLPIINPTEVLEEEKN